MTTSEDQLTFGMRINDVELLGVEVLFQGKDDHRGVVWIPFDNGLSCLFGRNGSGKTSLLKAVHAALSGIRPHGFSCRLYLRILATEQEATREEEQSQGDYFAALEAWEESMPPEDEWEVIEIDGVPSRVVPEMPLPKRRIPAGGWFYKRVIAAVPSGCEFFGSRDYFVPALGLVAEDEMEEPSLELRTDIGPFSTPLWWPHPGPVLSKEQKDAETWAEFQYPSWREICRLLLTGNALLDDQFVGLYGDFVEVDHLVAPLCHEIETSMLVCLEPVGEAQRAQWSLRLAAQVIGETVAAEFLTKTVEELEKFRSGSTDRVEAEVILDLQKRFPDDPWTQIALPILMGSSLLDERVELELEMQDSGQLAPFCPVGRWWSSIQIDHLPVRCKWLEALSDVPDLGAELIAGLASSISTGSLLLESTFDRDDYRAEIPKLDEINLRMAAVASVLKTAQMGVSGARLALGGGVSAALSGGLLQLEACDSLTGQWLSLSQLSDGQRTWVAMLLSLLDDGESDETVLIADEMDRGLAERAVPGLLLSLERLFPMTLLGTHSSAALRAGIGHIRHVRRNDSGRIELNKWNPGEEPRRAAEVLGVSTAELLSLLQVVILVEGEHDKVVLEEVFRDENPFGELGMRIVPIRGARGLTSADAQLVIDYSDALVVLLLDHSRQDRIDEAIRLARSFEGKKITPNRVKEVGSCLRTSDSTAEEKLLAELIERCYQRRLLDRIVFIGLEPADIIMLLDPREFGLDQPWDFYEKKYLAVKRKGSRDLAFKDFLRDECGASISTQKVKSAARKAEIIPTISRVKDQIVQAQFQAMLRTMLDTS